MLDEVAELGEGLGDQGQGLHCGELGCLVLAGLEEVSSQEVVGQALFLECVVV